MLEMDPTVQMIAEAVDRCDVRTANNLVARFRHERDDARYVSERLLVACRMAKDMLIHELKEPGRTAFWLLVDAIKRAEGKEVPVSDDEPPTERPITATREATDGSPIQAEEGK